MAIRLNGLAAPEGGEPGGFEATAAMRALGVGQDGYMQAGQRGYLRSLRRDLLSRRADIAAELVLQGLARDCTRYSDGRYAQAELHAAQQGATIGETYELPGYCRP